MLKMNILLVAGAGGAMLIIAMLMLVFLEQLSGVTRFLMPVPPLIVAVYVYLVNYVKDQPPETIQSWAMVQDIALASLLSAGLFFVVAMALAGMISVFSSV